MERSPQLEENKWYKVEVEQWFEDEKVRFLVNVTQINVMFQYFFVLRAEGREVFRKNQTNPKNYKNVKIYAAKYSPANAMIRNLSYQS